MERGASTHRRQLTFGATLGQGIDRYTLFLRIKLCSYMVHLVVISNTSGRTKRRVNEKDFTVNRQQEEAEADHHRERSPPEGRVQTGKR